MPNLKSLDVIAEAGKVMALLVDDVELFNRSILDQSKDYPAPSPVISLINNGQSVPFMTKKSFSLWQGKQKSKKTTALVLAVSAFITQKFCNDNVRFERTDGGAVLFFDNEQGESYAARTMKLILKLSGLDKSENLIYCDLREFTPRQRLQIIRAGIESTPNTKLVIIDGIVDLMDDFMDAKEGHTTVTDLLKLCSQYDIHIAGVLHQNKGVSKDARAHVGSISSQKCEYEIMAEVDPADRYQSIISCKESRGLPFEDFAIRWDKGELPKIVQNFVPGKSEMQVKSKTLLPDQIPLETHVEIIAKVLAKNKSPKLKEFTMSLKNEINSWYGYSIGENKTREYIQYYEDNKLIFKVGERPHTKYSNVNPAPDLL